MIVIPATLTNICVIKEPELVINTKWPANERKTPTQNTASDCWPHMMSGLKICHSSPRQSFDTNRVTTNTMTTKCRTRYGARFVLSLGLNASNSQRHDESESQVSDPETDRDL